MLLKSIKVCLFASLLSVSLLSSAAIHQTLLVTDKESAGDMPARFRNTTDLPNDPSLNLTGLGALHMVGSAQFSQENLANVINRLGTKKIIVIDLRQESHGFLNDQPISWLGVKNAANINKTPKEIENTQSRLLLQLSKLPSVTVYEDISKNDKGEVEQVAEDTVDVQEVESEKNLVEGMGLGYKRFYVTDHAGPSNQTVKAFLQFYKTVPKDTWIYFHCRGGRGRTSTFMIMVDILQNARTLSFDEILARQTAIGGEDLREMPNKNNFEYPLAVERLVFLKKFYESAKNAK